MLRRKILRAVEPDGALKPDELFFPKPNSEVQLAESVTTAGQWRWHHFLALPTH